MQKFTIIVPDRAYCGEVTAEAIFKGLRDYDCLGECEIYVFEDGKSYDN